MSEASEKGPWRGVVVDGDRPPGWAAEQLEKSKSKAPLHVTPLTPSQAAFRAETDKLLDLSPAELTRIKATEEAAGGGVLGAVLGMLEAKLDHITPHRTPVFGEEATSIAKILSKL